MPLNILAKIGSLILILMIAPVFYIVWYRKKQIKKKWPLYLLIFLIILFFITILIYCLSYLFLFSL